MSDTRAEAQEELHTVLEMSGNLEDSLGSALETSFSIPSSATKKSSKPDPAPALQSSGEAASAVSSEPIPGMDEWKGLLDSYTKEWQAESSVARAKAEATRKKFEDEHAAEDKAKADKVKEEKKVKAAQEKAKRDQERLQRELDLEIKDKERKGDKRAKDVVDRAKKVQEAWELVKPAASAEASTSASSSTSAGIAPTEEPKSKDSPVVQTDARGVTDEDVLAGQATTPGHSKPPVRPVSIFTDNTIIENGLMSNQAAYDPTTSTDPVPPVFQDSEPASTLNKPTESQTSATSQAWEEISGPSPSSSTDGSGSGSDDLVKVPASKKDDNEKAVSRTSGSQSSPPAQPPSLTLSLFTLPSHLSVSRVLAVVGINLVLPFINGVMLGFGEIFAREVIRVGKLVWRGERGFFGGARGVSGVGLSGSGGF